MKTNNRRVLILTTCEDCPFYNFDDGNEEKKWGKKWCEKLDVELKSTNIPDNCPLTEIPKEDEVKIASNIHEQYHLTGMSENYSETTPTNFAAMCCGNSFYEGAEYILKILVK